VSSSSRTVKFFFGDAIQTRATFDEAFSLVLTGDGRQFSWRSKASNEIASGLSWSASHLPIGQLFVGRPHHVHGPLSTSFLRRQPPPSFSSYLILLTLLQTCKLDKVLVLISRALSKFSRLKIQGIPQFDLRCAHPAG
jgi:hypothetical protein